MEEETYVTNEGLYPVLLMPKQCTTLESKGEWKDKVFLNVNIMSRDSDGNVQSIYAGFCNLKLIDNYDVNIHEADFSSQSSDSSDNLSPIINECNESAYPSYNWSQVWIDPDRSPYVYNNSDTVDSQEHYSVYHESSSSPIIVDQHNTHVTENVYNCKELILYSPDEEVEHQNFRNVQVNEPSQSASIEQNFYKIDELECGEFLTHLPEDIMQENENKAREELKYIGIETENDALKQLMSSDIQSMSKQQKTILYLGHDSHYGQTIQNIAVDDPSLECVDSVKEKVTIENHIKKKYQCDKCKQIFDQITTFKEHMVSDHKSPKITIFDTNKNTNTVREVKYKCTDCGKNLKNQKKFELHCLGHGNPELECNKCHKVFATKFTLRNHRKIHLRKHQCSRCPKTYSNFKQLKTHMAKRHFIYICELCDYTATKYKELKIHKQSHNITNVKETSDMYTLSLQDDFNSYSNTLTPTPGDIFNIDNENSKIDEIKNANSVLAKVMSNEIFLLHSKKARIHKKYKKTCDVCLKTFDRVGDLKRHLIEHVIRSTLAKIPVNKNGFLTIRCEVCQVETFTKVDKYKAHLREHAKLTLYKCTFCDKSFSDSSNFSKHKKIHSTTFFQCDLCQRKFNSKKRITQHMEYHNNNSPIQCFYCDKEFYFLSMLKKHIKCAHTREISRFRCRFCHVYFKTLKEKWDHEWTIHKVRKMVVDCRICGSKFRKYSELKRHCNDVHNMEIAPAKKLLRDKYLSWSNKPLFDAI